MALPVVIIHSGNSSYLINTLYQLRKLNADSRVYLIGTDESKIYRSFATHISMDDYMQDAHAFENIYTHFSTNSIEFELICIQRWFILKEFLCKNNIDRCLYLDSDVLFYSDINQLAEKYQHVGMTRCGISGHTNFVKRETLQAFCRFITLSYTGEEALIKLHKHYIAFVEKHKSGGVSDMTFITNYAMEYPDQVIDIYTPLGNETFDPSLIVGNDYFEMDGAFKRISFKNDIPIGFKKSIHEPIVFHTLHFQGSAAKHIMAKYIPDHTINFRVVQLKYKIIYMYQKIMSKIHKQKVLI